MISVTIHTNKMQEVAVQKFHHGFGKVVWQRWMEPHSLKTFTGFYQKEEDVMIEWAMNMFNKAIGKGLRCQIRVYKIKSFSPYESRLLYTHDG